MGYSTCGDDKDPYLDEQKAPLEKVVLAEELIGLFQKGHGSDIPNLVCSDVDRHLSPERWVRGVSGRGKVREIDEARMFEVRTASLCARCIPGEGGTPKN